MRENVMPIFLGLTSFAYPTSFSYNHFPANDLALFSFMAKNRVPVVGH